MYLIIPICIYNWIIDPILLFLKASQIIPERIMRVLLNLVIIYIFYKTYNIIISFIFSKLQFNLKNDWINYLTFKGWKIRYYKDVSLTVTVFNDFGTSFLKVIDYISEAYMIFLKISSVALVFFSYFILCSILWADYAKNNLGFDVWKSEILLNYVRNLNLELANLILFLIYSILLTSLVIVMLAFIFIRIYTFLIQCMFPITNRMVDTSDVPISFIKNAIAGLESFNFSDNFMQRQHKKNQITQLISYALNYFIKVDSGKKDPDFTNFCYVLWAGHLSEAARNDVLFRTNGLYKKIDELCVKINNMSSPDDNIMIVQDLKRYLKVIEDRDLSKIEEIPYKIKKSNLTTIFIKTAVFLQKII